MVPLAFENPRTFGLRLGVVGDALAELCFALRIAQLDAGQRRSAVDEMNVCIVEAGNDPLSAEVDDFGGWARRA